MNLITSNNNTNAPGGGAGIYCYANSTNLAISDNEITGHTYNNPILLAGSAQSLANSEDPRYVWVKSHYQARDPRVPLYDISRRP